MKDWMGELITVENYLRRKREAKDIEKEKNATICAKCSHYLGERVGAFGAVSICLADCCLERTLDYVTGKWNECLIGGPSLCCNNNPDGKCPKYKENKEHDDVVADTLGNLPKEVPHGPNDPFTIDDTPCVPWNKSEDKA